MPPGYLHEVELLTPLFREADDAHRIFTVHVDAGQATPGWETRWDAYKGTPEYRALLDRHWTAHQNLEAAIQPAVDALNAGQKDHVDRALAFLSIRYRPFRSGYACTRVARALKKVPLDDARLDLLRRILLDRVTWPWASVKDLWSWIPRLRTPTFDAAIRILAESDVPWIAERAARLSRRYLGDLG